MYVIESGAVQVYAKAFDGSDVVLARLEAGQWFGEQALLPWGTAHRNASVRALEDCRLLALTREVLLQGLAGHGELLRTLRAAGEAQQVLRSARLRERVFTSLGVAPGAESYRIERFRAGTVVFQEGDPGDRVYLVLGGRAQALRDERGAEVVVSELLPGQFFGELAILRDAPRSATVRAVDDLETVSLDGRWFHSALRETPGLRSLMESLSSMYLLPRRGVLTLQTGRLEGQPSLTAVYTLPDGRRVVSTGVAGSAAFTSKVVGGPAGTTAVRFEDPPRGLFRELGIAGGRIVGIQAEGEWRELGEMLGHLLDATPVEEWQLALFRARGAFTAEEAQPLYEDAEVMCACTQTTCGRLQRAIAEGCHTLEAVAARTGATLVCGGCTPLVRELLGASDWSAARVAEIVPDRRRAYLPHPSRRRVRRVPGRPARRRAGPHRPSLDPARLHAVGGAGRRALPDHRQARAAGRVLSLALRPPAAGGPAASVRAGGPLLPRRRRDARRGLPGERDRRHAGAGDGAHAGRAAARDPPARGLLGLRVGPGGRSRGIARPARPQPARVGAPAGHPPRGALQPARRQGPGAGLPGRRVLPVRQRGLHGDRRRVPARVRRRRRPHPRGGLRGRRRTARRRTGEPGAMPGPPRRRRRRAAGNAAGGGASTAASVLRGDGCGGRLRAAVAPGRAGDDGHRHLPADARGARLRRAPGVAQRHALHRPPVLGGARAARLPPRPDRARDARRDHGPHRDGDQRRQPAPGDHRVPAARARRQRCPRVEPAAVPLRGLPQARRQRARRSRQRRAHRGGAAPGLDAARAAWRVRPAAGHRAGRRRAAGLARDPPPARAGDPIVHPQIPWFADLGLKWYALPAVSGMRLDAGGLVYPAAPFNGWYMGTEIGARNFGDTTRYDLLPVVARRMGLDTTSDRALWRDRAIVELNVAVLHSYERAGVTMLDHHAASHAFDKFEALENAAGRPVHARWSWIVPPISGSTTTVFHKDHWQDIELTPAYRVQPDPWKEAPPAARMG